MFERNNSLLLAIVRKNITPLLLLCARALLVLSVAGFSQQQKIKQSSCQINPGLLLTFFEASLSQFGLFFLILSPSTPSPSLSLPTPAAAAAEQAKAGAAAREAAAAAAAAAAPFPIPHQKEISLLTLTLHLSLARTHATFCFN